MLPSWRPKRRRSQSRSGARRAPEPCVSRPGRNACAYAALAFRKLALMRPGPSSSLGLRRRATAGHRRTRHTAGMPLDRRLRKSAGSDGNNVGRTVGRTSFDCVDPRSAVSEPAPARRPSWRASSGRVADRKRRPDRIRALGRRSALLWGRRRTVRQIVVEMTACMPLRGVLDQVQPANGWELSSAPDRRAVAATTTSIRGTLLFKTVTNCATVSAFARPPIHAVKLELLVFCALSAAG